MGWPRRGALPSRWRVSTWQYRATIKLVHSLAPYFVSNAASFPFDYVLNHSQSIFFLLLLQCSVRAQVFLVLKGKARESARLHGNAVNSSCDFGIVKNCIQCVFKSIKPSNNSCCNKDIMWNGVTILNPYSWKTSSCISSTCYGSCYGAYLETEKIPLFASNRFFRETRFSRSSREP